MGLSWADLQSTWFVECEQSDDGAFPVTFYRAGAEIEQLGYLRQAWNRGDLVRIVAGSILELQIYVVQMSNDPAARIDALEKRESLFARLARGESHHTRYVAAELWAIPLDLPY